MVDHIGDSHRAYSGGYKESRLEELRCFTSRLFTTLLVLNRE